MLIVREIEAKLNNIKQKNWQTVDLYIEKEGRKGNNIRDSRR